jgi:UDP-galactopyranose mutase
LFNVVAAKAKGGQGVPNDVAAFYAGGINEALGHFQYRNLKFENVMIDGDRFIKIADLVFAKVVIYVLRDTELLGSS